ncbi:MAG TPA: DUF6578 domain-containing protein [Actinomycetota bacterium]|nr:DUF6578 domain-containing protein [Actinomycetota bacterium]
MQVPIWVSAFELECCQPDANVGEPWEASLVGLRPPEPWWAKHSPEPVPDDVLSLGVVDLEGTAASATLHTKAAIVDLGGYRVIVPNPVPPGPVRVHGRLWLDAHAHPELSHAAGLEWRGTVRRIRGIHLVYQPVTVYLAIPIRQQAAVDVLSTSDRRDPSMADRGFAEFLIDLEV